MAKLLGDKLTNLGWIDLIDEPDTNMLFLKFTDPRVRGCELQTFLQQNKIKAMMSDTSPTPPRIVVHHFIR